MVCQILAVILAPDALYSSLVRVRVATPARHDNASCGGSTQARNDNASCYALLPPPVTLRNGLYRLARGDGEGPPSLSNLLFLFPTLYLT